MLFKKWRENWKEEKASSKFLRLLILMTRISKLLLAASKSEEVKKWIAV